MDKREALERERYIRRKYGQFLSDMNPGRIAGQPPERLRDTEAIIRRLRALETEEPKLFWCLELGVAERIGQLEREANLLRQIIKERAPRAKGAAVQQARAEQRRTRIREAFMRLRERDPSYTKGQFFRRHADGLSRSTIMEYLSDL